MRPSWTLEADLQDLAVVADEPSCFWIRKGDRPIAAHLRQLEPGLSFIGSPGGCAGSEVWLSLGRDHDGPLVFMAEAVRRLWCYYTGMDRQQKNGRRSHRQSDGLRRGDLFFLKVPNRLCLPTAQATDGRGGVSTLPHTFPRAN